MPTSTVPRPAAPETSSRLGPALCWAGLGLLCIAGVSCRQEPPPATPKVVELPEFPPGDPEAWVCEEHEFGAEQIQAWCDDHPDRGTPAALGLPADIADPEAKNAYDEQLRQFLRDRKYREQGWIADQRWRLTGPYVGPYGAGKSYGVHPAVRIWYSPEMADWLCAGREGEIPDGAMIVKEMHGIDAEALGLDPNEECMRVNKAPEEIEPESWTVMVRANAETFDGWYWANPTASGDGNPPVNDRSGISGDEDSYWGDFSRNPKWYPTGDLFGSDGILANTITPYSEFGAYCLNCHASAESHSTYATLDNVLGEGLRFRHYATGDPEHAKSTRISGAEHVFEPMPGSKKPESWGFSVALDELAPGWAEHYGELGPTRFAEAAALRLPAETYDHRTADPASAGGPATFLSSDQCIGCHDATVSNDSTPNMLEFDIETGKEINISPYGEWRASPMGLAGRDPIFFAQLQSETNNLAEYAECIENTCLHCHGVMGQRTWAADKGPNSDKCKELYAVPPPEGVAFADEPFRLDQITKWGGEGGDPEAAKYGALARDGISCTVCHRVSEDELGSEATFTGNFLTLPGDEIIGPYASDEIIPKPMEHALGVTPRFGEQIKSSELCGSCHNILLPVFTNAGEPYAVAPLDPKQRRSKKATKLYASYEQSTHLEWQNSVFGREGDEFQSCQDCHMPKTMRSPDGYEEPITGISIANIQSDKFPPVAHRLPAEDLTLRERDSYSRHSLHGLNIFQNQLFQQFPLILGVRQIDYMGSIKPTTQPALVTASHSIVEMAQEQTASVELMGSKIDFDTGKITVRVMVRNKAGHYFPSGVGFRRAFVELSLRGPEDELLWASGRTNELGLIVEGTGSEVLDTESGARDVSVFQPHYQRITRGDQVQIYQEVIKDCEGHITSSFLRRCETVKDNRLRPRGFDPSWFLGQDSPYIQLIGEELEHLPSHEDPYYSEPKLTGGDIIEYEIQLDPLELQKLQKISVRLYNQSIPPAYLQQRFDDAAVGPGEKDEIERLYYMTSHLRTDATTPIEGWKLLVAQDCKTALGEPC